ncbi:MAG: sulfur carrier protein ThiS [Pseudomonadota bacterium]
MTNSKTNSAQAREAFSLTINGEAQSFDAPLTVDGLLAALSITGGKVAVERNRAIVPRSQFGDTVLADGDSIEIVKFVGGG